jgi:NTE family protein
MLFHAGALLRLNELGLLTKVRRISSVSGRSIAAGYLSLMWDQLAAPVNGSFPRFKNIGSSPCFLA